MPGNASERGFKQDAKNVGAFVGKQYVDTLVPMLPRRWFATRGTKQEMLGTYFQNTATFVAGVKGIIALSVGKLAGANDEEIQKLASNYIVPGQKEAAKSVPTTMVNSLSAGLFAVSIFARTLFDDIEKNAWRAAQNTPALGILAVLATLGNYLVIRPAFVLPSLVAGTVLWPFGAGIDFLINKVKEMVQESKQAKSRKRAANEDMEYELDKRMDENAKLLMQEDATFEEKREAEHAKEESEPDTYDIVESYSGKTDVAEELIANLAAGVGALKDALDAKGPTEDKAKSAIPTLPTSEPSLAKTKTKPKTPKPLSTKPVPPGNPDGTGSIY